MEKFNLVEILALLWVGVGGFGGLLAIAFAVPMSDSDFDLPEVWVWRYHLVYSYVLVLCGRVLGWW
jgi:hypothetical protein